jgi:hypothetical protein
MKCECDRSNGKWRFVFQVVVGNSAVFILIFFLWISNLPDYAKMDQYRNQIGSITSHVWDAIYLSKLPPGSSLEGIIGSDLGQFLNDRGHDLPGYINHDNVLSEWRLFWIDDKPMLLSPISYKVKGMKPFVYIVTTDKGIRRYSGQTAVSRVVEDVFELQKRNNQSTEVETVDEN